MENTSPAPFRLEFDGKYAYSKSEPDMSSLLRMGFGAKNDGGVRLNILEAAYLVEKGKCEIFEAGKNGVPTAEKNGKPPAGKKAKPITTKKLLGEKKPKNDLPSLSDQFIIFKAFRAAGHVVRFSSSAPHHWRVFARGVGREQDRPSTLVMVVGENWSASPKSLLPAMQTARLMRLELAIAFVSNGKINAVKLSKLPMEI